MTPTEQLAQEIWAMKYKHSSDSSVEDTFRRVAHAVAPDNPYPYFVIMNQRLFCPGGRILAGAGTGRNVTLFNCYVMGTIEDSLKGILQAQQEAALTMQQGGGVGMDFSTIRPRGDHVAGLDAEASGPISFMRIWDATCRTIMSAGARRGAMMGVLRVDHPDIEEFILAKRDPNELRMFNMSVGVTDEFMTAVVEKSIFNLQFNGKVYKTVPARYLWDLIMRSTYNYAEPGILFLDTINNANVLNREEYIAATNPCGEQALPPFGACLLGSINLPQFIKMPFTEDAVFDLCLLEKVVPTAVDFLDRVIDISNYPLPQQEEYAKKRRRIGLGITGLADALAMMGLKYSSKKAVDMAGTIMGAIAAYARDASNGRNSHLLTIAPTGTTSLFLGNVSSGLEPIFALEYTRKITEKDGTKREVTIEDYAVSLYKSRHPGQPLPDYFETMADLEPEHHLAMQAELQKHVDNSISKTINVPVDYPYEKFKDIYINAWLKDCKGCTTYRPNDITGSVLSVEKEQTVDASGFPPRPHKLPGATYKLNWPGKPNAYYVTLNDKDNAPYEVFVSTKDPTDSAWLAAISRLISAVYRRGGPVDFVATELQEIYDAAGGMWVDGIYIPSFLALLGRTIAEHAGKQVNHTGTKCPSCGELSLTKENGCDICKSCGYSKCS